MKTPSALPAWLLSLLLIACSRGERDSQENLPPLGEKRPATVELTAEVLEDKLRGGLLAQLFGNLNGLPHEFKYIQEPGALETYTPDLAEGARTDDDTDLEWVYIFRMQQTGEPFLAPAEIAGLWRAHINRGIWCANAYARQLMELGLEPPLTGRIALNPWSSFNISGQFICESFGLAAPAMPQSAARLGLNYTHVTIDGEPAQATQLFTAMIAEAYLDSRLDRIIAAGLEALDPASELRGIVDQVRAWHEQYPDDWRQTRELIRQSWARHGGEPSRDGNGYEINTACTIAALLYGDGNLAETLRLAFNLGWDCDNNAATAATILGVIQGRRWMEEQGWPVLDRYRNTSRDGMPEDETITRFGDRLLAVAEQVILQGGGAIDTVDGRRVYRIRVQRPANVEPLPVPPDRGPELRELCAPLIEQGLDSPEPRDRARAAYLALCLDRGEELAAARPRQWKQALAALEEGYPELVRLMFEAPPFAGERIAGAAAAAGLRQPAPREN